MCLLKHSNQYSYTAWYRIVAGTAMLPSTSLLRLCSSSKDRTTRTSAVIPEAQSKHTAHSSKLLAVSKSATHTRAHAHPCEATTITLSPRHRTSKCNVQTNVQNSNCQNRSSATTVQCTSHTGFHRLFTRQLDTAPLLLILKATHSEEEVNAVMYEMNMLLLAHSPVA